MRVNLKSNTSHFDSQCDMKGTEIFKKSQGHPPPPKSQTWLFNDLKKICIIMITEEKILT